MEVHVVRFPSQAALEAFMGDPRRDEHGPLLEASGAAMEVRIMEDVG